MDQAAPLLAKIETVRQAIVGWSQSSDPITLILVLIFIVVVAWFRRGLAAPTVKALFAILKRLNANLGDNVRVQLVDVAEILIVTLACYIGLEIIDPPNLAGGLLRRAIISVAVIAVFAAWYELAAAFAALLIGRKIQGVRIERDWITRVTRFAIVLFGLTSLLKVWEIDISAALTGVGVLGAGLAIAAQDLIRNLVAGMTNQSEERFETGDAIEVPGQFIGSVARIDLRSTLIVGFDQIPRYVPNSDLASSVVLNYSRMSHRRVWTEINLLLSTTEEQIVSIKRGLLDFVQTSGLFELSSNTPQFVYAHKINDHGIQLLFVALTKTGDYEQYLSACEKLNLTLLKLVSQAGTELAYPTQTIQTRA